MLAELQAQEKNVHFHFSVLVIGILRKMVSNAGRQLSSVHLGHFCKTRPFYTGRWMFLFEVEQKDENCSLHAFVLNLNGIFVIKRT